MEKINLREERDFGQKISATFLFLQQNFGSLFKSLLYYAGPVSLLAGVFMGLYQSNFLNLSPESMEGQDNPFQFLVENVFNIHYVLALLLSAISRIVVVGIIFAYLAEYLENPQEEITTSAVWNRLSGNFLTLFLTSLVYILGITLFAAGTGIVLSLLFFGTATPTDIVAILPGIFLIGVLIIVPVIFFSIRFCLFPAPIFIEEQGMIASLKRSWQLVKGKWWSTFGLGVVISIIVAIMGIAFQMPLLLISIFKEILQWEGGGSNQMIIILASIIGILGESMLAGIVHLAMGFQYFNLAERQESIGLMEEIDSLGRKSEFNSNEGDY